MLGGVASRRGVAVNIGYLSTHYGCRDGCRDGSQGVTFRRGWFSGGEFLGWPAPPERLPLAGWHPFISHPLGEGLRLGQDICFVVSASFVWVDVAADRVVVGGCPPFGERWLRCSATCRSASVMRACSSASAVVGLLGVFPLA